MNLNRSQMKTDSFSVSNSKFLSNQKQNPRLNRQNPSSEKRPYFSSESKPKPNPSFGQPNNTYDNDECDVR